MNVETIDSWLPLMEYSTKYRVSVSTLRRRIKADDISFRFEDGKYFIMDEPVGTHQRVHRPSRKSEIALVGAHQGMMKNMVSSDLKSAASHFLEQPMEALSSKDEPVLLAASKLLNELKVAYCQVLKEKEDELFLLKEEIADLKTYVSVLEAENHKLNQKNLV